MNIALHTIILSTVLAVSSSRYILVEMESGKTPSFQMRLSARMARTACKDLASEKYCKALKPHCGIDNTLIVCAHTCEAGVCECKDDPYYEKCKHTTLEQCKLSSDLRELCPKTCNTCPGSSNTTPVPSTTAKPTYQCPRNAPYLEKHVEVNHGDVCRKFKGDTSIHECPHGCLKTYQAPYCIAPSTIGPCRVPKDPNYTTPKTTTKTVSTDCSDCYMNPKATDGPCTRGKKYPGYCMNKTGTSFCWSTSGSSKQCKAKGAAYIGHAKCAPKCKPFSKKHWNVVACELPQMIKGCSGQCRCEHFDCQKCNCFDAPICQA